MIWELGWARVPPEAGATRSHQPLRLPALRCADAVEVSGSGNGISVARSYLAIATNHPFPQEKQPVAQSSAFGATTATTEMGRDNRYKVVLRNDGTGPGRIVRPGGRSSREKSTSTRNPQLRSTCGNASAGGDHSNGRQKIRLTGVFASSRCRGLGPQVSAFISRNGTWQMVREYKVQTDRVRFLFDLNRAIGRDPDRHGSTSKRTESERSEKDRGKRRKQEGCRLRGGRKRKPKREGPATEVDHVPCGKTAALLGKW